MNTLAAFLPVGVVAGLAWMIFLSLRMLMESWREIRQ